MVIHPPPNVFTTTFDSPSQSVPKSATPRWLASVSSTHWTQLCNAQKRQGRPNVQTAREIIPIGLSRGLATRDHVCFDPRRPPPGGAKTASNRISRLPLAMRPYYAARRAFCQTIWMEMKPASYTILGDLVTCRAYSVLRVSSNSKGNVSLALDCLHYFPASICSGVNINRIFTHYSLIDFLELCSFLSIL